jgi:Flp pilus assembly protein TadD
MTDIVPLLKFTPSAQDPKILEAITVQREPLIAGLVDSALDTQGGVRHHLLVGPRGIGKTHILSLVASRIRAAEDRDDSVVMAWLDEDPWAIRTYDKFLAAVIARVAAETDDAELARSAVTLRSSREETSGLTGEELLRGALGDRRLVLLVENLDEIFRRIGPDGQARFRAFAEDWRQLLILASTPQLFAGVRRHTSPFYGFFAVTHLDELSLESATELLKLIAKLHGDSALLRFLSTDIATRRLTAIEAMAGGHPRVWLLLAGCISIPAIDELVPLFLEALDDLTPYYQDRLRELGDQQQELVVLLGEAGGALSNRELAERSGVAQNQVATMLRQLSDRGYVRRARLPGGLSAGDKRTSFWELREPLMRLCLDVKQARGEPLRMVVEFLRAWYGPSLLDELGRIPPSARLATTYASEAFRTLETPLEADDLFHGSPNEILSRVERGLTLQPQNPILQAAKVGGLLMAERYREACDQIEQILATRPSPDVDLSLRVQLAVARQRLGESVDADGLIAEALELRRSDPDDPNVMDLVGCTYTLAGQEEEALAAFTQASELDPSDAEYHHHRGLILGHLGRHEEALAADTKATELDPGDASYHDHRGFTLGHLGRHEEALAAHTQATELDPTNPQYHNSRADALRELGRIDEAERAARHAIFELEGENELYRFTLAEIILTRGDSKSAVSALRDALSVWSRERRTPPGETGLLCRLLWEHFQGAARREIIAQILTAYGEIDSIEELGRGVVSSIPLFVDDSVSQQKADSWVGDWSNAPPATGLEIPLNMLEAARAWKRDRDKAHLLALPPEQREILVNLLTERDI